MGKIVICQSTQYVHAFLHVSREKIEDNLRHEPELNMVSQLKLDMGRRRQLTSFFFFFFFK